MHTYKQLQYFISNELSKQAFNEPPAALFKPIKYILSIGGKRLRPVLALMATELFDGDIDYAVYPALGIEIFHNFTLLHDDVMDNASFRRGKPTVHEKWNGNVAILSGDAMSITAYQYVVKCEKDHLPDVLKVFNQTAVNVCQGQQLDMEFENRKTVSIDEYLKMIKYKTAVLLGCSLRIGGILADASLEDQQKLYNFGVNLGMAFQLQDDYLDTFGEKKIFGKNIGGDIIANKKTFLLIKALENTKGKDSKLLHQYLNDTNSEPSKKIKTITEIYEKLNIRDLTQSTIRLYIDRSIKSLDKLNIMNKKKIELYNLIQKLAKRSF